MQIQTDRNQKEIKTHGTYLFPVCVSHEWLSNYERHTFMWHWHPELEWTYVLEGTIHYQVHDQEHILKAGEGILCNSNMPHTGKPVNDQDCHYVSVTLHPRLLEGYKDSFLKEKYVNPIVENPSLPCLVLSPSTPWQADILEMLKKINEFYQNQKTVEDYDFRIYLLLMEIWSIVCRHTSKSLESQIASKNLVRLKQILTYIHDHYHERITLTDIAAQVNICPSECCRFFKRTMHESLFDYLLNYRIEQSLALLAKGENVTETALQCGFSTLSYFSKTFRERTGHTPREYQKTFYSQGGMP